MFHVLRKGENHLEIVMSGKLDSSQMKVAMNELFEKSEGIEEGTILCDIIDFHVPSLGAIGIELSMLPEIFSWVKKFNRVSVLSDTEWLRKAGEIKGKLIPGLEIKAFDRGERIDAENWLGGPF